MKKMIFLILSASLCLAINSCKKYSEDNRRFLKTPCTRLYGKWKIERILTRQGDDISEDTVFYSTQVGSGWRQDFYIPKGTMLSFNGSGGKIFCVDVGSRGDVTSDNVPVSEDSYFEFRRKKTEIKFDVKPNNYTSARYLFDDYGIKKLTNDELVLESGKGEIHFKAVE